MCFLRRVFLASCLAVGSTVCWSQSTNPTPDPSRIFRQASPSVVTVLAEAATEKRQGSAVAVGSSYSGEGQSFKATGTWFATNAHVVVGAPKGVVVQESGQSWQAKVEYLDEKSDIALLHVPTLVLPILKPDTAASLDVGSKVFAIGSPLGLERTLSEGLVSAIRRDGATRLIQTTAAISPGSSGGALLDQGGRLVGITSFKMRNGESLNFAVDAARVQAIKDALTAAALFQAVYTRTVVLAGSEEDKDVSYMESSALAQWMLETLRSDGTPTYKWFLSRSMGHLKTKEEFWGGHPEFDALQSEFLATRPRSRSGSAPADIGPVVRLVCRMNATRDGTYQFDLNVAYDESRGTVNGLPAKVTSEQLNFQTGKDAAFTAVVNRFSMVATIGNAERPNLLNGACTRLDKRGF